MFSPFLEKEKEQWIESYAVLMLSIATLCWDYLNLGEGHRKIQVPTRDQVKGG